MSVPPNTSQNTTVNHQTLDCYNGCFTLNGSHVEVKIRPDGKVRIGCTIATRNAIEEISRLAKMGESA